MDICGFRHFLSLTVLFVCLVLNFRVSGFFFYKANFALVQILWKSKWLWLTRAHFEASNHAHTMGETM